MYNMELNDLTIIIYLRKSKVSVEGISVCDVIEKFVEHKTHRLPCSDSDEIIDLFL